MIEKNITFFYGDNESEVMKLLHPSSLEKTAGLSDTIMEFVKLLSPKKDKSYALINALSAMEYYGSNRNGDAFPEDELKEYHKTFELFGHLFKHHVNKDPEKSIGKVIFSFYNPVMHRVELIVEMDNVKAKDVIDRINAGELVASSMGVKIPRDFCSICNNGATTREMYCSHLKNQMGQILPGGRKVYAINRKPKFFDISIVTIPADRTSSVLKLFKELLESNEQEPLKKVASYLENSYTKVAEFSNNAQISKVINSVGETTSVAEDPKALANLILQGQQRIKEETLSKLASYPLNSVLSTFLGLRIIPDPRDFQKLALYSRGFNQEADQYDANEILFDTNEQPEIIPNDVSLDFFNEKIASLLYDELPNLTLTKEHVISRNLIKMADDSMSLSIGQHNPVPINLNTDGRALWKQVLTDKSPEYQLSPIKNPILPLGMLGGLYLGFAKVFNDTTTTGFRKFMLKNPWLLPVLIGAGTAGTLFMQHKNFDKTASSVDSFVASSLLSFPASYYLAAKKEFKGQQGEQLSRTENFARKHPALIGLTGALAGAKATNLIKSKLFKVANFVSNLPMDERNRIFIDLLSINGGMANG